MAALFVQPLLVTVQSKNIQLFLYSFFSLIALLWLYKVSDFRQNLISSLGIKKPTLSDLKTVIPVSLLYIVASVSLTVVVGLLFSEFNAEQAQEIGFSTKTGGVELVAAFFSLVIFTPFIEEVIFRGVLFRGLRTRYKFWPVVIATSLIFAIAHAQWNVAIDTFVLGIALAYLVEKTGGITASIFLHALKNFIAFSFLFIIQ
jgi:membrane protease YdiL (CAAX protease family)